MLLEILMENKFIDQVISDYLSQLKQALAGQDPALILDAQYDAEDHLRSALAEEADPQAAWPDVCERYGCAQEIAEFYCDVETKVNLALNGKPVMVKPVVKNRFFAILKETQAYRSLLYVLVLFPVGMIYFSWVTIFGLGSLSLSMVVIGIPLFLMFLRSMQVFSLFEGRLIEALLGQRMPRRPQYQKDVQGWLPKLRAMALNRRTWSTIIYMGLQLPLGMVYFFSTFALALLSVTVFLSPVVDPILHSIDPVRHTIDIDWYWFPLAMPGGVIGFTLALHGAKAIGRFQTWLAKYLLVSASPDD
jgi:hypothetical protein